jgi:hypothetical protein
MIIRPPLSAHARDEQGCSKDGTADADRRRHRQSRDDPIVVVAGEQRHNNSTVEVAGERRHNNSTTVVDPLSVAWRTALPLPPTSSGGAFFVVPPTVTVPQANTTEDNKDDCTRAKDACNERGRGEDARRDCGVQQEEAPAEEGQPDRERRGGAVAR